MRAIAMLPALPALPLLFALRVPCRIRRGGQNRRARRAAPFLLDENTRSLVSRALANDRDAVDVLFQRYRDRLRQGLRKLIGPKYRLLHADSEDAAQDAILSALRRLHQFEYRGDGSFLAWLLKGAEFEIVRRIRALETRKRTAEGGLVDLDTAFERMVPGTDPSPSDVLHEQELAERVRQALQQLPDREREVIVLRRYLELETEEICEEMGLPTAGSVRALLSRAQARLAGLLSRDEGE
jgi:RNA polymerase sigma-70 factor (ECF subfamily)